MLRQRLLLGPVLIVLLALGAWLDGLLDAWSPPITLGSASADGTLPPNMIVVPVLLVVAAMAARELARLLRDKGILASTTWTVCLALAGLMLSAFMPETISGVSGATAVSAAVAIVVAASLAYYSRRQEVEGMIAAAGGALLAFGYLGLMLGLLAVLRREHSAWVLLWMLIVTKSCDIGAYFTGRAIGRTKLAKWLSPGKTWEGLAGGVAFSAIIGAAGAWLLTAAGVTDGPTIAVGAFTGALFGVVGQLGDLLISLLKRDAGVKDAGGALPGFGGVLDVLDSALLVAPVAVWALRLAS